MFEIEVTPEALEDFRGLRKYDQKTIVEAIETQLRHQADQETKNRKRLRPNALAEWEMRVDTFRLFYDIAADPDTPTVKIVAVGQKHANKLFIHGEEYEL